MRHHDAIGSLERMPEALLSRLAGLSDAQLRLKPAPDVFSALENVCHLRDIEIEGYARRLGLLLREDHPHLPNLDGAALARERRYNEQELRPALDAFLSMRRRSLGILISLSPQQLARRGRFEHVGEINLAALLELWVEHDRGHIQELDALLPRLQQARPTLAANPSRSLVT